MKKRLLLLTCLILCVGFTYSQCSNPYAGQDTAFCGNTGQLSVENATTGYWTANLLEGDMSAIVDYVPSSTSEEVVVITTGTNVIFELIWVDESGPCNDTVLVEFVEQPIAYAGEDFDVCGNCADLVAIGDAEWTGWLPAPGSIFGNYSSLETEVCYNSSGVQNYTWLISNSSSLTSVSCSDQDDVSVTFWREPTANILTDIADSVTCGLTCDFLRAEYPGEGIYGYWICPTCGANWDYPILDPVVDVPTYGYHVFYWVEETGPALEPGFCKDTAEPYTVHFLNNQPLYAGHDEDVYNLEHTLHGLSDAENNQYVNCIYLWENEEAIIDNPASLETMVTVSEYKDYEFILSSYYTNMEECVDIDTVKIRFVDPIYQDVPLDKFENEKIKVFPNPTSDFISIQSQSEISQVYIINVNGSEVFKQDGDIRSVDVSEFDSGLYFGRIILEKETFNFKFIKE